MAVDTATKRFSMMSFGNPVAQRLPYPPDGTIAQGDRQTFLHGYSGILWGAASTFCKMFLTIAGTYPAISMSGAVATITMTGAKGTITIGRAC